MPATGPVPAGRRASDATPVLVLPGGTWTHDAALRTALTPEGGTGHQLAVSGSKPRGTSVAAPT